MTCIHFTPEAKDVLLIMSPENYKEHFHGYRNWLFTMFESETMPDQYKESLGRADILVAPSSWVANVFENEWPEKPVFVVNHGVKPGYKYKNRHSPVGKPFRFLWIGAPNQRKGWDEIIHVWEHGGFSKRPELELYIKTTKAEGIRWNGNVIVDGRNISERELVSLYHSAHCFLFPTRGEGFGLTLAEAMATGLPCIATDYSGHKDFFDGSVGYPLKYELRTARMVFPGDKFEADLLQAFPDLTDLFEQMVKVLTHYQEALERGKKAAQRIRSRFTWFHSANALKNALLEMGACQ
jgi:hypothetical protein